MMELRVGGHGMPMANRRQGTDSYPEPVQERQSC